MAWKRPLDDGGAKIIGYVIEKKGLTGPWEEILEVPSKDHSVTIKDLNENEDCQFRVRAKNAAGLSIPSRPTDMITVQDQPE